MTETDFNRQMDRLKEVFGERAYAGERVKRIWQAVGQLDPQWFKRVVDGLIDTSRQAPLAADFYAEVSRERERIYSIEKNQHGDDAKRFFSSYAAEDVATLCGAIKSRVKGALNDEEFDSFKNMLKNVSTYRPCRVCGDEGYVFLKRESDPNECVYRCRCRHGLAKASRIPFIPEL